LGGLEGPLPGRPEAILTQLLDGELEPALGRVLEIAVLEEHVEDGLGGGQGVAPGYEISQLEGEAGRLAQAAPAPQLVAGLALDQHGDEAPIVDEGVLLAAAGAAAGDVDPARH